MQEENSRTITVRNFPSWNIQWPISTHEGCTGRRKSSLAINSLPVVDDDVAAAADIMGVERR